ncbi:hypothetical protein ABZ616_13985 [Streptomyces noursei]|uniref:hypothetical protein n=1 Tax=Streptomyces TaxID=1883 RepID=UPI00167DF42D|nr:hypothetical protein [Streptomyces mashuensis]
MDTMTLAEQCRAIVNDGGLTFSPTLPAPVDGFMVSIAGSERTIPVESFGPEVLAHYVADYASRVTDQGLFFGAWVDCGLVYLDLSMNVTDRAEAEAMGRLESQLAIFDVVNGEVISL